MPLETLDETLIGAEEDESATDMKLSGIASPRIEEANGESEQDDEDEAEEDDDDDLEDNEDEEDEDDEDEKVTASKKAAPTKK